mmetsp:Transcript_5770/g.7789  ORF Transcript_5770/g.7789 Transcript_5770/m.7789 type:complete len:105 (+) Transcript_5770:186-500(+)
MLFKRKSRTRGPSYVSDTDHITKVLEYDSRGPPVLSSLNESVIRRELAEKGYYFRLVSRHTARKRMTVKVFDGVSNHWVVQSVADSQTDYEENSPSGKYKFKLR